jgi:Flp pilus assembly protein TadD
MPALLALTAISLGACTTAQPGMLVEQGYDRGALGVAAIDRGDWASAEQGLTELKGVSADDPARLINLGKVYMETGRPALALSAWRLALASEHHFDVETRDGRVVSTAELARQALAMHETGMRSASR